MKNQLPKVGEICFFHEDPIVEIADPCRDCVMKIGEFYLYDEGDEYPFTTRDDYSFKYCTSLGDTHNGKKDES